MCGSSGVAAVPALLPRVARAPLGVVLALLAVALVARRRVLSRRQRSGLALSVVKQPSFAKAAESLSSFRPPAWASNGFVQTVLLNYWLPAPELSFRRELVALGACGGTASVDWCAWSGSRVGGAGSVVALVFPALGTSCRHRYVRHLCEALQRLDGAAAVGVVNVRGSAGTDLTSSKLFDIGSSADIEAIVSHARRSHPGARVVAVGASMGSNILVRYLSDPRVACKGIDAACSVSNPFDLKRMLHAEQRWPLSSALVKGAFEARLVQWFKRRLRRFEHLFCGSSTPYDLDEWLAKETMAEFSEFAGKHVFGYASFDEYLDAGSCTHLIDTLAVPTLFVQALDDPLVSPELIPRDKLERSPHASLLLAHSGGHIAFVDSRLGTPWFVDVVVRFLSSQLEARPETQAAQAAQAASGAPAPPHKELR
jgi:predicted alpha/beta-fold hydrolase